jgi:ribonuclease III
MSRPDKRGLLRILFPFAKSRPSGATTHAAFQKIIKYRFKDPALLALALTHKSSAGPDDKKGLLSNERLEFLGDSVLNCLVTEHLYHQYPTKSEGQLSKVKSLIVSRKILGEIAQTFCMGDFLLLGQSEKKTGGAQRISIMSNAFEAVIGAIYLDGGLSRARTFLNKFLFCNIETFCQDESNVNYKSKILEFSQRDGFGIPRYKVVSSRGPEHAKEFTMLIEIAGVKLGEGEGSNKKIAEQNAARCALLSYSKEHITTLQKGDTNNELVSH